MREKRLSVRALAKQAGISHSAVSRLLNGRSRATVQTLGALAPVLGLTLEDLLRVDPRGHEEKEYPGLLEHLGVDSRSPALVLRVRGELDRLRAFAGTREGRMVARDLFFRKVEDLGATGPLMDRLRTLHSVYLDQEAETPAVRSAAGSAVLYFIQAVDAIDDFLWPIGYLDDAIAIELVEQEIDRLREETAKP